MRKLHFLIVNDDGISAPGLKYLVEAAAGLGEVTIVAPEEEKSSSGLSLTLHHPLRVRKLDLYSPFVGYSVSGTPADCVKLALSADLCPKPDLILSGINPGSNAGRNLLYSGTVGGVIEGALKGFPGIAFSHSDHACLDFSSCTPYISTLVTYILNHPLPLGTILNVNFPDTKETTFKGIKWTRQGKGMWMEAPRAFFDPKTGETLYWIGKKAFFSPEEESDTCLLEKGFVTAVPIKIDELTDEKAFEAGRSSLELFLSKR